MHRFLTLTLLFLWSLAGVAAQGEGLVVPEGDELEVSLLTCTPGKKIYELYGHTAVRVKDLRNGEDWVFNYGMFSFKQPNFVARFVAGKTDYQLGVEPMEHFLAVYRRDGRGVDEQVLRLTASEKERIFKTLLTESLPENATYRYNFLYNNCTTRAIDLIDIAAGGQIEWPRAAVDSKGRAKSLRDIIHEFSAASPWDRFGQDLVLGNEIDAPATRRHQSFSPIYAENFLAAARRRMPDGSVQPLAEPAKRLLPATAGVLQNAPTAAAPGVAMALVLLFTLGLIAWEGRTGKTALWWDCMLLTVQGMLGLVVGFLFFFSEHPAVGSNWLVAALNPLPLALLFWYVRHARRRQFDALCWYTIIIWPFLGMAALAKVQVFPYELWLFGDALWLLAAHRTKRASVGAFCKTPAVRAEW